MNQKSKVVKTTKQSVLYNIKPVPILLVFNLNSKIKHQTLPEALRILKMISHPQIGN